MRILCIRFTALGDVVLTTGLISVIRKYHPEAKIDFVTSSHLQGLLEDLQGIRKIHGLPKGSGRKDIAALAQSLSRYDYIFDWQGSLKSGFLCRQLKGQVYRIQKQSLTRRLFVRFRWGRKSLQHHVVEKYGDTCFPPLKIPPQALEELRPDLGDSPNTGALSISPKLPETFVAVHPFASQKNKEWPYFPELCKRLMDSGHSVVVVGASPLGLPSDFPNGVFDLVNTTPIKELAPLLGRSQALVTTDSGPLHIGVAVRCPTLAIFGPTTRELGFFPEFQKTVVVENKTLSCRPCHVHGGNTCPKKHFKCMKDISVDHVLETLEALKLPRS